MEFEIAGFGFRVVGFCFLSLASCLFNFLSLPTSSILREGQQRKAHSLTKEVRGLAMESLTKGGTTNGHAIINLKVASFLAMTQKSGNSSEANRLAFCLLCKKQNSGYPSEANRLAFCSPCKKQNSGNQPEFQSSIKKRTVNQTVCYFYMSNVLKS